MSTINEKNAIQAAHDKWAPVAAKSPDASLTFPVRVILGEAVDLAALYTGYWDPSPDDNNEILPGFSGIAEKSEIHENTGTEIYEIVAAAAKANADYEKGAEGSSASPMVRAEFVLYELKSTLEFVFDDDEHTLADDQLDRLSNRFPRPTSHDEMAVALEAYTALADEHRADVTGIEGFDLSLLDEALVLAGKLRERSAEALVGDVTSGIRELIVRRNRLLTLLQDRMNRVRRAARYVFRAYPDIAQKFTSAYQRERRRDLRRRKATELENAASEEVETQTNAAE